MNHADVAARLGMAENEVVDVVESDVGPVARLFDGTVMVFVDDAPQLLVAPTTNYQGTYPVYDQASRSVTDVRALADAEAAALERIGASGLADVEPQSGSPEALASGRPDAALTPGDEVATVDALVTDAGPPPVVEADGSPTEGQGYVASEANDETGAANVANAADPSDVGTVVPDGNRDDVLLWAGEDRARLQQALDFELSKEKPRSTLVAELEAKLA